MKSFDGVFKALCDSFFYTNNTATRCSRDEETTDQEILDADSEVVTNEEDSV